MNSARSKNSKRNIIAGIASSLYTLVIGFIIRTIIIYAYNEKYLGLVNVFTSIISVLNMAELGFSSAIVVSMYKPIAEKKEDDVCALLAYYKKCFLIIGCIVVLAGICVIPWLPKLVKGTHLNNGVNIYILYAFYVIDAGLSYVLYAYKTALLTAVQRYDIVKNTAIITSIIKSCIQLIALLWFDNFYMYAGAMIFSTFINNFIIHVISSSYYPNYICRGKISDEIKKEIKIQVGGLAISKMCEVARNSLDNIILSGILGLTYVAIYDNYYMIYGALTSVLWSITRGMQASIANSIVTESIEKNYYDFRKFGLIFNWIVSWCTCCLFSLYQPFMKMWVGDRLTLSTYEMMLFCIYFYSMHMNSIRNLYFDGNGLWWSGKAVFVLETISNLVLNITLGYFFGIAGILFATIITIVIFNYLGINRILFRKYFININMKEMYIDRLSNMIITLIVCALSYTICISFYKNNISTLLIRLISCTIVSNIGLYCWYHKKILFKDSIAFIKRIFIRGRTIP